MTQKPIGKTLLQCHNDDEEDTSSANRPTGHQAIHGAPSSNRRNQLPGFVTAVTCNFLIILTDATGITWQQHLCGQRSRPNYVLRMKLLKPVDGGGGGGGGVTPLLLSMLRSGNLANSNCVKVKPSHIAVLAAVASAMASSVSGKR